MVFDGFQWFSTFIDLGSLYINAFIVING